MNVDVNARPAERKSTMASLITQVVNDLDSSPSDNVKAFVLHLGWHEGAKLKERTQIGGGPGRSFFQFEPPRAKDAVAYAKTKGWLDKLATASGKTAAEIEAAGNALPSSGGNWGGNLIETLLTSNDLFGTYLARISLRKIPATIPAGNSQHAEYWADHWKIVFGPPPDRANKVAQFLANANEVDGL
jgi:hypothetical protein